MTDRPRGNDLLWLRNLETRQNLEKDLNSILYLLSLKILPISNPDDHGQNLIARYSIISAYHHDEGYSLEFLVRIIQS